MSKFWNNITRGLSIKWIIFHYGPLGTIRWVGRSLPYHLWLHLTPFGRKELRFDEIYGVHTDGVVEPSNLEAPVRASLADAVHYAPSRPKRFFYLMSKLPVDYSRFTFVDVGAGKGRVLLLASQFPFKKVIGVEFSPTLVATAQENIDRYCRKVRKRLDIQVVCADASEYEMPRENLILYMWNPFGGKTFDKFLSSLEESIHSCPREIYVLYWSPMHDDLLAQSKYLERVTRRKELFSIYRTAEMVP